jgi:hypothetical protein
MIPMACPECNSGYRALDECDLKNHFGSLVFFIDQLLMVLDKRSLKENLSSFQVEINTEETDFVHTGLIRKAVLCRDPRRPRKRVKFILITSVQGSEYLRVEG